MRKKLVATHLAALFIATLAVPWAVLAGGGGGRGGGGPGRMGGDSIGNRIQTENQIRTHEMEPLRMRDGEGDRYRDRDRDRDRDWDRDQDRDRDRDRDRIHKESGTKPAAAATKSAVTDTGVESKKGHTYGPGDGTGPYLPKDGTGYGAPTNR